MILSDYREAATSLREDPAAAPERGDYLSPWVSRPAHREELLDARGRQSSRRRPIPCLLAAAQLGHQLQLQCYRARRIAAICQLSPQPDAKLASGPTNRTRSGSLIPASSIGWTTRGDSFRPRAIALRQLPAHWISARRPRAPFG